MSRDQDRATHYDEGSLMLLGTVMLDTGVMIGNKEKELKQIEPEAYREIQTIQGVADAKATEIYAAAYNQFPESRHLKCIRMSLIPIRLLC
jgi:hypothetical protein|tara:strand:- start:201 stop:473 length:273 start_codon:yes stop_codon:yes gene_type:complete